MKKLACVGYYKIARIIKITKLSKLGIALRQFPWPF